MPNYVGLDVSQKTTSICVVDERGRRLWRGVCATDPDAIATRVIKYAGRPAKNWNRDRVDDALACPWTARCRPRCRVS